jgi:hypothetical protein
MAMDVDVGLGNRAQTRVAARAVPSRIERKIRNRSEINKTESRKEDAVLQLTLSVVRV